MKNACPKCGTAYNVSASVIGRKFTCKNCGTPVVVTDEGLDYQNAPAKAPSPPAPAPVAASGGAFDFDAADDDRKSSRGAKAPRPSKDHSRDEEEASRDTKKKRKYEDDEEDDIPARKPRRTGSEKNVLKDFLFFKEFVAPVFVKLVFVLIALVLVGAGLVVSLYGLVTVKIELILGGILYLFIMVPFYLLFVRIYCEIILLGFAMYDRLGEIKTLLEKSHPPAPPGS